MAQDPCAGARVVRSLIFNHNSETDAPDILGAAIMTTNKKQVAIVFPAEAEAAARTRVEQSRLAGIADALASVGLEVVSAPFTDDIVEETKQRLADVNGVLVWFNPIEGGRDRSVLNEMLRHVGKQGAFVSAHPDVIDKMGTKELLYRTRNLG